MSQRTDSIEHEPVVKICDGEITELEQADRRVAGRRCLIAQGELFGVRQTFAALGILARARQEGWARHPVILPPRSAVEWR